ncbi:MAG: YoaK family protein [Acetobacteraceae bacterium]
MTMLAGFVDAVGYTAMAHLYFSFMSGNSTQLGMAVARDDMHVAGWSSAIIATFVLGAFLGTLIQAAAARTQLPLVLACELAALLTASSLYGILAANAALLPVALAMGMQNAIHQAIAGAATGKSFVTGALFGIGESLAQASLGKAPLAKAGANTCSWLAFFAGVTCGTLGVGRFGTVSALLVAAAIVLVLMALSILWRK